ncbi:MAG: Tetratricopeptide 4 [Mycobacterium sp.]|nr:Tetratricopeptide 4 [Mycobacterium sp.]
MTPVGPPADPPVESGPPPNRDADLVDQERPSNASVAPSVRGTWTLPLRVLVAAGVLLLAALAPVAHYVASHLPLPPNDPTTIIAGTTRSGTTAMRNLPVGLPAAVTIATSHNVYPYAVAALGIPGAQAFMALLSEPYQLDNEHLLASDFSYSYPYRYPALEPILNSAPPADLRRGAIQLAAALIRLAGQPRAADTATAAQAAYALLDRTRASGGCDAQLDLMLLVVGDPHTSTAILADELRRTTTACPNDPTPGWIVGQTEIRQLSDDPSHATDMAPIVTFQALSGRFPQDTSVVTGLGDAYLQAGLTLLHNQPFTARQDLRLAVAQYNRAAELGDAHDADLGRAHALIGLGESKRAVPIATQVVANSPRPGAALKVLLAAYQGAGDFASAEDVARRLDEAGPAAYPAATAFFPGVAPLKPFQLPVSALHALLPLSTGAETLAPLEDSLVFEPLGEGAGASVNDVSFIPQYRDDGSPTADLTDCPSLAWRRDAVVAGHAVRALENWPQWFYCGDGKNLRSIAELVAGQAITDNSVSKDQVTDDSQNLLRWAGDLPGARKVISSWEAADGDSSAVPALRLGEVAFLQQNYNEAAAQFDIAARRASQHAGRLNLGPSPTYASTVVEQAELDRGAALFKAGRSAEAVALLRPLELGAQSVSSSYFAAEQLADFERETGDLHAAVDDYNFALGTTARPVGTTARPDGTPARPEVLHNNLALTDLALGATDAAASEEGDALKSDPEDPVFLMTAGFIADRAGKTAQAADYDRRALQNDPGDFPAANDLGVEHAREHNFGAAEVTLRQAIGAKPDYALGWFNLGVLEGLRGPLHLLASQGAFGKAFALDPTLKDRRHELTIDGSVYRTGLDLSKPLPPRWSLTQTQRAVPVPTAGLLAVLLLAAGLARSFGRGGSDLAKQWLDPLAKWLNKIRGVNWLQRPVWAIVATVVTFLLTYLRRAGSPTEIAVYALGVILLTGIAIYVRIAIANRTRASATQSSWLPGIAFGLVTGAAGLPWAPLPVVKAEPQSARIHLAAPLTLAALSLVLFVEFVWLNVPLTQVLAVAALVMAGSTLLPIDPLDGANVGKAGAVAAAGVVGGALLVTLGLI